MVVGIGVKTSDNEKKGDGIRKMGELLITHGKLNFDHPLCHLVILELLSNLAVPWAN